MRGNVSKCKIYLISRKCSYIFADLLDIAEINQALKRMNANKTLILNSIGKCNPKKHPAGSH